MDKKTFYIIIIAFAIMVLLFFYGFKSKKSNEKYLDEKMSNLEQSIKKYSFTSLAASIPRYGEIEAAFKGDDRCFKLLNKALQKFNGKIKLSQKKEKFSGEESEIEYELAMVQLTGQAEMYSYSDDYPGLTKANVEGQTTILIDENACSEKLIEFSFCILLNDPPPFCRQFEVKQGSEQDKNIDYGKSHPCFRPCSIVSMNGNQFLIRQIQNQPCELIEGYVEGMDAVAMECDGGSCKSNFDDIGCCKSSDCNFMGGCHLENSMIDVDNDKNKEACISINGKPLWVEPDSRKSYCENTGLNWIDCDKGFCAGSRSEFCCGDDYGEKLLKCNGNICIAEEYEKSACCSADSCIFDGKCYKSGCNKIADSSGKITAYCDTSTNSWIDLDNSRCSECLGKESWNGNSCCGDDANEGKMPLQFIVNEKNGIIKGSFYSCSDDKSDCAFPESQQPFKQGFYLFGESSLLSGGYYCKQGQWHSPDIDKSLCIKSGNKWMGNDNLCCGDKKNEHYTLGDDKKEACCENPTDILIDGICTETNLCGNSRIDPYENCEIPGSINNANCGQKKEICLGKKLGSRDTYGYCSNECKCTDDEFEYSCNKNFCGAECSLDTDCQDGYKCNKNSCECVQKKFCGDNVIQAYNDIGQAEECEPPGSIKNSACKIAPCYNRLSANSPGLFSVCGGNCRCDYSDITYSCIANQCNAECDSQNGCSDGMSCNLDTCLCYYHFRCGNGICEEGENSACPPDCLTPECPHRIELSLNKGTFYYNDTIVAEVATYNVNNELLPNVNFDIDFLVDGNLVGSSSYETSSTGRYYVKRKVNEYTLRGSHGYIAKTQGSKCSVVSDTKFAYVDVANPIDIRSIGVKRSEYSVEYMNISMSDIKSPFCGDAILDHGEACEGNSVCRKQSCDYKNQLYYPSQDCQGCNCPQGKISSQDYEYCKNCKACGDGKVNCDEECEIGKKNKGKFCKMGVIYELFDICKDCKWKESAELETVIDKCRCDCQENPEANCINGNYINYTSDYNSGCHEDEIGDKCNECKCKDEYTTDLNRDGTEDKCSREICGNRKDDNDNGAIDEEGCIWYYCGHCGYGAFDFCDRKACLNFQEGCYFRKYSQDIFQIFNYSMGSCSPCKDSKSCSDYGKDAITCVANPCLIDNCGWNGTICCSDFDKDGVCDDSDNCIGAFNPEQEDSDYDNFGDLCDSCASEKTLLEPQDYVEVQCSDGVDNDCDSATDCNDKDCKDNFDCCPYAYDCVQDNGGDFYCTFDLEENCISRN